MALYAILPCHSHACWPSAPSPASKTLPRSRLRSIAALAASPPGLVSAAAPSLAAESIAGADGATWYIDLNLFSTSFYLRLRWRRG